MVFHLFYNYLQACKQTTCGLNEAVFVAVFEMVTGLVNWVFVVVAFCAVARATSPKAARAVKKRMMMFEFSARLSQGITIGRKMKFEVARENKVLQKNRNECWVRNVAAHSASTRCIRTADEIAKKSSNESRGATRG